MASLLSALFFFLSPSLFSFLFLPPSFPSLTIKKPLKKRFVPVSYKGRDSAAPVHGIGFPELEGGVAYISYPFSHVIIGIGILPLIPLVSMK